VPSLQTKETSIFRAAFLVLYWRCVQGCKVKRTTFTQPLSEGFSPLLLECEYLLIVEEPRIWSKNVCHIQGFPQGGKKVRIYSAYNRLAQKDLVDLSQKLPDIHTVYPRFFTSVLRHQDTRLMVFWALIQKRNMYIPHIRCAGADNSMSFPSYHFDLSLNHHHTSCLCSCRNLLLFDPDAFCT